MPSGAPVVAGVEETPAATGAAGKAAATAFDAPTGVTGCVAGAPLRCDARSTIRWMIAATLRRSESVSAISNTALACRTARFSSGVRSTPIGMEGAAMGAGAAGASATTGAGATSGTAGSIAPMGAVGNRFSMGPGASRCVLGLPCGYIPPRGPIISCCWARPPNACMARPSTPAFVRSEILSSVRTRSNNSTICGCCAGSAMSLPSNWRYIDD